MSRVIIDLSVAIEHGLPSDPEMMIPQVGYIDHAMGAEQMEQILSRPEKAGPCPAAWAGPWKAWR